MSWTDERVARLSKLWAEGLSASQIANDLGGVTRNAVIGKVHRLGLSGRAKPAGKSSNAPRRKSTTTSRASSGGGGSSTYARASASRASTRTVGNAALKMELNADAEIHIEEKRAEDVVVPISRKLTLMQLTETTCKWPTGDPTMPGFSFCGQTSEEDKPYCEFHSKLAFQPPNERRRRR